MDRRITTYEQAIEYLYGRINYERAQSGSYSTRDFKLDRVRRLLAGLGDPQEAIPAIHIAGTKGKGTTAAMVAGILEAAGFRVGLFTSPHISAFEERMMVGGRMPAQRDIVNLANRVAEETRPMDELPGQMSPTFFEITMAMGWLWFVSQNVDIVVLEVGLGGRLDATNVCRPLVSVITNISRDHTGLLGSTLAEIAAEKAGIIKPGVPVVCGVENSEAYDVIREVCRRQNAPLTKLERDIRLETAPANNQPPLRQTFSIRTREGKYEALQIPFSGRHQLRNAGIAVGVVECLIRQGWPIPDRAIQTGLAGARCPLRIEVVQWAPAVVLDVAHNWASVSALLETLSRDFSASRRILIFAASRDKDVTGMLRLLLPEFDTVVLTQFASNPRGMPAIRLSRLVHAVSGRFAHSASTPAQAWNIARGWPGRGISCAGPVHFSSRRNCGR